MWNLSKPPVQPFDSQEVLIELAAYYRQLMEHHRQLMDNHRQAATVAAHQLSHVEALLNLRSKVNNDWNLESQPFQASHPNNVTPVLEIASLETTDSRISSELFPEYEFWTAEKIRQAVRELLVANHGTILHLDYLLREISKNLTPSQEKELKEKIGKILEDGVNQGDWYAVPDSPDCWTIDLKEFPDFFKGKTNKSKTNNSANNFKKTKYKTNQTKQLHSRLPDSAKLAEFPSLVSAVAKCLEVHYPKTMSSNEVLRWLYPEGLPEAQRQQARSSISDTLNKRCGSRGWQRVKLGEYIWDKDYRPSES